MRVNRFGFRKLISCGASLGAIALAAASGAANAQETPTPAEAATATQSGETSTAVAATPAGEEDQAIVVTGFRASIASAINVKRNENGVVDAIVAEDIADFPDLNLAESLQRIPGVAITRVQGEGRGVSVRGLGSEYTRVRLNGMEAISTSSGTANSGGTNRGRGFDFNIFASDLFSALIVRKTDLLFVAMSWIFVVLRLVHAGIHVTTNRVGNRFMAYTACMVVLLAMWIIFAVRILLAF